MIGDVFVGKATEILLCYIESKYSLPVRLGNKTSDKFC